MTRIGVLGAGTWGMALARMLCNSGHDVTVWSALEREIDEFSVTRHHPNLPGMVIPEALGFTKQIEEVCRDKRSCCLRCLLPLSGVLPERQRPPSRTARSLWTWRRASRQIPCSP